MDTSLLEKLQANEDALEKLQEQSVLTISKIQEEAKRREAQWKNDMHVLTVNLEVATDLNTRTQSRMQDMLASRHELGGAAKEWEVKYAQDSALWTNRYEKERDYRREIQAKSRARISKMQADLVEQRRSLWKEGELKRDILRKELSSKLAEYEKAIRAKDAELQQLRGELEMKDAASAEQPQSTSVRALLGQTWGVIIGRVRSRWSKLTHRSDRSTKGV